MNLKVEISADELKKVIAEALTTKFKKTVNPASVVFNVNEVSDFRGDSYGHTVSATVVLPE